MIGYLEGTLLSRDEESVILGVGGVGYEVRLGTLDRAALPLEGGALQLHIHTHVREDEIALFGFLDPRAKALFQMIIGLSGIGPSIAMDVIGAVRPEDLIRAVMAEDAASLKGIRGVGPSKVKRLMELKPKLVKSPLAMGAFKGATTVAGRATPRKTTPPDAMSDALAALEALGYARAQVYGLVGSILDEDPSMKAPAVIKAALQQMGREAAERRR